MIVDWHAHVRPPEWSGDPSWGGRMPLTIERLLEAHEQAGIDLCVVSNTIHNTKGKTAAEALALIQRWNEYAAEIQATYPDRTVALSATIPGGGPEYLRELERAITQYGLKGVLINSSHHGHYPDEDDARGFFELVTALDVPVMMHAPASSFGEEVMREYRLTSSIGRPFDECLSVGRMLVRGIWEQFPTLRLVAAHLGGGICEVIGRMDYAYDFGDDGYFLGPYGPLLISHRPSHYLQQVYLDTVSYHAPAVMCAYLTVGARHLLFGSDAPPMLPLLPRAKQLIEDLPICQDDKAAILGLNALRVLKLPEAADQPAAV